MKDRTAGRLLKATSSESRRRKVSGEWCGVLLSGVVFYNRQRVKNTFFTFLKYFVPVPVPVHSCWEQE